MARRRPATALIRSAITDPIARTVLGALSASDLQLLAKADGDGDLGVIAGPILAADNPSRAAEESTHPVGQILAKLSLEDLEALAASCPPTGCR
jgi:hypothetical protein